MPRKNSLRKEKNWLLLGSLACLFMIIWLIFSPFNGVLSYYKTKKNLAAIQQENLLLEKQNAALRQEIDKLRHDVGYLEEVARKEYGLIKKNEVIYDFGSKKR